MAVAVRCCGICRLSGASRARTSSSLFHRYHRWSSFKVYLCLDLIMEGIIVMARFLLLSSVDFVTDSNEFLELSYYVLIDSFPL